MNDRSIPRLLRLPALLALPIACAANAQAPSADGSPEPLTIGSKAPVPQIERFVQGSEPTKWFEPGKVWVVEFWATWCGPCKVAMPHMSDLADKYKDRMVVVGVSDEKIDTVTEFMAKPEWKEKARYAIATDPDRSTHQAYMEAAGQGGIPTAFLVKDGTVQWIGHPMSIDEPLAKVLDGTWDAAAFKPEFERKAESGRKQMAQRAAMAKARKSGDWSAVIAILDRDIAAAEGPARTMTQMTKFKLLVTDAGMPADGYALGREILAANKDNAQTMNDAAWFVLDSPKVKQRDIPFAQAAAQAAVDASKGEDPAILDTMARACWESGDKAKAIEWQKKAIDRATGDMADMAGELRETLQRYQSGDAPTKKTSLLLDDAGTAPGGTAPGGAKPGDPAPSRPAGAEPSSPRAPRPARPVKLTEEAEKAFPAVADEGFDSPEAIVAYLPDAGKDAEGMVRMLRAMRPETDGGRITRRVAAAMIADMAPVVTASAAKFGKPTRTMVSIPGSNGKFDIKREGDDKAMLMPLAEEGKPAGQPIPLVKADGKWFLEFERATGIQGPAGSQTAEMANMMGGQMRDATRKAAESVARDITDGKIASAADANAAFAQRMAEEMMAGMGGGPGAGGPPASRKPGAGAPAGTPAGGGKPSN